MNDDSTGLYIINVTALFSQEEDKYRVSYGLGSSYESSCVRHVVDEERNGLKKGEDILVSYYMRETRNDARNDARRSVLYPSHIKFLNQSRIESTSFKKVQTLTMLEIEVWEYIHDEEKEEVRFYS